MSFKYEEYDGDEGILRFSEISKNFDFGPHLPAASFTDDFVTAYINQFEIGDEDDEFFLAHYPDGPKILMLETIDSPRYIHSQNYILSESQYADPGSIILPPGHYSFGSAVDDDDHFQLMVNLKADDPDLGKIYVWRRAYNALGEGDNTEPMGFCADNLAQFLAGMAPYDEL